jgi:hypothetical protein
MAIKRLGAQRFAGLFADVGSLPVDADLVGAIFDATDTIQKFVFDGSVWQEFVVGTGEINTGANVGAGTGTIFRDKIGVVLNFKSLIGGDNITVTNNADDITITSTGTSPLTTKGDIYGFSTVDDRVPVGTDGQILSANSVNPIGVEWIDNLGEVFLWSADHNMNGFAALNSVFADFADPTKLLALDLANITTGIVLTLSSGQTTAQDLLIPNITQADTLVTEKLPQILSLKTLDIPTITDFTNAAHDHADAAGGGTLLSTDALSDTDDIAYLNTPNTFLDSITLDGETSPISIEVKADEVASIIQRTFSDTLNAINEISRSRGEEGVGATTVIDTDILGSLAWSGFDGNFFTEGANIRAVVNGVPSAGEMPTDLVFSVASGPTVEEGLRLRNTKSLLLFGELDVGTNKIINVVDPTELQDVATKNYVDESPGITQRQSTDPRPDGVFLEQTFDTDTGETHIYNGQQWIYDQQNDEHKSFFASIPRTSFIVLLGDTFASSSQSFIGLLESTTNLLGGNFVNVGSVTFSKTGFLNGNNMPFRGYTTAIFDGTEGTSLLTLATESSIEVGTGDLIKGCFIQTDDFGTNYMLQYGDIATGASHGMFFNSSSRLAAWVSLDGINFDNVSAPERFMIHGRTWHHIMYQVKRSNNTLSLFIDGNIVDSTVMTNVGAGNLNSSVGSQVGAGLDGTVFGEYFGQMCLLHEFHGTDAEDVIPLMMAGIRESTLQGVFGLDIYPGERLNNLFGGLPNTGDYMTTVINTSEGIYDLEVAFEVALEAGQTIISIDGIDYLHNFHEQFESTFQQVANKVDIPLSGGSHILKVRQVNVQTARYAAITLIKREGKYNEDDECSSGIILGDSMRQYKSRFPDQFEKDSVSWGQEWGFNNDAALNYAGGDHFLKRGNYKITMTAEQISFQQTVNVYFGGVKVFDEDDTWINNGDSNFSKSVYAFLEGGKTQIRYEVPPTPANGGVLMSSIKFEMIDGKADNNFVSIYAGDGDWEDVQGVNSMVGDSTVRFNTRTTQTGSPALNDEFLYKRYFSGGTYVFDMNYYIDTDGGIIDIFLDGDSANPFVAGLNTNGSVSPNNTITRTVIIPRGNHTVHMKVVGGSSFEIQFMAMLFHQIGVDIDQSEFNSFDGQDGKTVPLASYTSRKSDNSVELFLGDVSSDKFTDIIIKGTGKTDASLALQLEVNGLTANYNIFRNDNNAGVLSTATATQANLEILPTTLIDSARVFSFDVDGKFDKIDNTFGGNVAGLSQLKGDRIGHWSINNSFGPKLSSVIIKTSANNWLKDTQFEILGIRK